MLAFGLLYLETATNIVIALDPETGRERWRFDPHIDRSRRYSEASARGVSLWEGSDAHRQAHAGGASSPGHSMRGCWRSMPTPAVRALTSALAASWI